MAKAKTSEEYGAQGGKKRAANLTKEQLAEIGRKGAAARWNSSIPVAEYTGAIRIGDIEIPCAVLGDGTRVLTQWGFLRAIGRSGRPAAGWGSNVEETAPFLKLNNLKPFISKELADSTKPIVFRTIRGTKAFGYRADLLPKVCSVYLDARDAKALLASQEKFARACDLIIRGLAEVGIVALVDEATGYQANRARDALAKILEAFVQKELRKWVSTFPPSYYEQLCRLRNVPFPPEKMRLPQYFGGLTNSIVYDRIAPGVKDELKRVEAERRAEGHGRGRLHQHLTAHTGVPKLSEHLAAVTVLMKVAPDYDTFEHNLDVALPRLDANFALALDA